MGKKLKLSTSSIKTYEQCNRKYYYQYILKPEGKVKDWPHLRLGNFLHEVLEDFHKVLMVEPSHEWPKLMSKISKSKLNKYKLGIDDRKKAANMLRGYLNKLNNDGLPNVMSAEPSFKISLTNDVVIRGFIDRIDRLEDSDIPYHIVDYKGLALDTKIPTPEGWTTMKDLSVGDLVLGSNGKPTSVIAKSRIHHRPCYKIVFSDNSEVICDNVHNWQVDRVGSGSNNYAKKVLSGDMLYKEFKSINKSKYGALVIQNADALEGNRRKFPLDPYLLGAWLGDALSKAGTICTSEGDYHSMNENITNLWAHTSRHASNKNLFYITCSRDSTKCKECEHIRNHIRLGNINDSRVGSNLSLSEELRALDLLNNKFIPQKYLRASFEQRLSLLQGLMDTDGHWSSKRKCAVFVTANDKIKAGFSELLHSFGVTVQYSHCIDKKGFESHRFEFKPVGFCPFRLERKKSAFEASVKTDYRTLKAKRRAIKSITPIASVPTQCISVDSDDKLYLCGESFIPTHNTGKSKYLDEFQLLVYGLHLLDIDPNLERYKASYLMLPEGSRHHMPSIFTKTDLEEVKNKILSVANSILTDEAWEPKPQFLCKYCDFNEICPAYGNKQAANGRVDWE